MIQSNKEDLSQNISHIKKQAQQEKNKKIETIANSYINYIQELNLKTKSSNKNFYILIQFQNNSKKENKELIFQQLNEEYYNIKECLARCGNSVYEYQDKKEVENIIFSFFNYKKYIEEKRK